MNVQIHGEHLAVTEAMREFISNQLSRLYKFSYISVAASSCRVNLNVMRKRHTAEMTVYSSGKAFHAEATDFDMYKAIQLAVDMLERQLGDYKNKVGKTFRHRNANIHEQAIENDRGDQEDTILTQGEERA